EVGQVLTHAGVRQLVEVDDLRRVAVFAKEEANEVRSDETGAARDEISHHQIQTSLAAVMAPPASPVFGVPTGSIRMILHSSAARGLCSLPRGTTNISPGARTTLPSRKSMVSSPSTTMNASSVSGWLCQTKSPSTRASLN